MEKTERERDRRDGNSRTAKTAWPRLQGVIIVDPLESVYRARLSLDVRFAASHGARFVRREWPLENWVEILDTLQWYVVSSFFRPVNRGPSGF